MPDCSFWPKISIVTPSYNQGQFIEETIRSVLLQGYPNLEYIIIDGGSTDDSVEIIRKYEKSLTYWVSEPDQGQSDALNKGFQKSTGEILAFLDSDDTYEKDTLKTIGEYFRRNEDTDVFFGDMNVIDEQGKNLGRWLEVGFSKRRFVYGVAGIPQPAAFFRKMAFERAGRLRNEFFCALDSDLWLRMCLDGARFHHMRKAFANYRRHSESKTSRYQDAVRSEEIRLRRELLGLNARSLSFRLRCWLYRRLWRAFLLIQQGDGRYIFEHFYRSWRKG